MIAGHRRLSRITAEAYGTDWWRRVGVRSSSGQRRRGDKRHAELDDSAG
jgi:hypothetical protein